MTVMSGSKWCKGPGRSAKQHDKEIIHSGHFMVSEFEAEDQDDDDEVAVPVPEERVALLQSGPPPSAPRTVKQQLSIETNLTKLFQCMSLAYRQKLTSPKWNMFKGLRLRWKDKIRLNNVIWRCWHIQFVNRKRTLVCQFASPLDIHTHNKPEAIVMEGKYWKRRLHAVTAEYKKWRMFYRNRLLGNNTAHDMLFGLEGIDWQSTGSVKESNMLVDDDYMDFVSDTLLATITANQPFAFPDSREIARGAGLADLIQPSLVQLQPNLDEFMDLEPFQELSSELKLGEVYPGDLGSKASLDYFGAETSSWVHGDYCRGTGISTGGSLARQVMSSGAGVPSTQVATVRSPPLMMPSVVQVDAPGPLLQQSQMGGSVPGSPVRNQPLPRLGAMQSTTSLPPYQQQASTSVLTDLTVRRPPITTTTNTFFFHKKPGNMRPAVLNQTTCRSSQQAAPLLNQMLTEECMLSGGGSYPYMKTEEGQKSPAQDMSYILQGNVAGNTPVRIPENTFLFTAGTSCGSSKEMVMQSTGSLVAIPGQSQPALVSTIQPLHSMAMVSASGTTSPESPVNSEPLSPVNMTSPLSSPSPSKPSHVYKEQRRSGHINAEQMRRCNIKNGFDTLHAMLPQLNHSPTAKVSKAALLQKGAEYIRQLRSERSQLQHEIDLLRQQVDQLNSAISVCQEKLPATGAPVSRQKSGKMLDMFRQYVRLRTLGNWKFWILSLMCEPLLVSFADCVSTGSPDELYNTTLQWLDQHCTLVQLRPVVLNALKKLCTVTEVLADPQRLPIEARNAVQDSNRSLSNTS